MRRCLPVSDSPMMTSQRMPSHCRSTKWMPRRSRSDVLEPVIEVEPDPEFDKLTLTVGRGDTMEKLFRKNNLDVGHLMPIAQLDEARAALSAHQAGRRV